MVLHETIHLFGRTSFNTVFQNLDRPCGPYGDGRERKSFSRAYLLVGFGIDNAREKLIRAGSDHMNYSLGKNS